MEQSSSYAFTMFNHELLDRMISTKRYHLIKQISVCFENLPRKMLREVHFKILSIHSILRLNTKPMNMTVPFNYI